MINRLGQYVFSPPVCIFSELSAMIRGMDDGKDLIVRDYTEEDLDRIFENFF